MPPIPLDWTTTTFRAALVALAKRKVPPHEAEDLVQQVLTEAIGSAHRPEEPGSARKWIYGILRNKIADYHRAKKPMKAAVVLDELAHPSATTEQEQSLLRWAMRELPSGYDAQQTLDWLLREGDGEKLEDIAESDNVPAPQVRQRVSRLRRYFRERWLAQLAAAAVIAVLFGIWLVIRTKPQELAITPAPERRAPLQLPAVLPVMDVVTPDASPPADVVSPSEDTFVTRPRRVRRGSSTPPSSLGFTSGS